jgi:hypothetical protein
LELRWKASSSSGDGEAQLTALAAAFAAAAAAAAAPARSASATAATAPAPAAGDGLQLASLSVRDIFSSEDAPAAPTAPLLLALPASSLTHLDFNISWSSEADVAALCSLTGLRRLQLQGRYSCQCSVQRVEGVAGQSDSVLAQLSVLQQLTRLELASVRRVQLQHLQLPRLQHLDVTVVDSLAVEPLLLAHMTGLTALAMNMNANSWSPADELLPNLGALELVLRGSDSKDSSRSATTNPMSISLQPLLGLSHLQQLHLELKCVDGAVPTAEEMAQLSTLRSLREVRIVWDSYQLGDDATLQGIAAAFALLPLKALTLRHAGMSAAVMQQLGCLQGLTALELEGMCLPASARTLDSHDCATPAQLAVALRQLAALRYMRLQHNRGDIVNELSAALQADDSGDVAELLQAIDGLRHLIAVRLDLPVQYKRAAFRQLHMQQLVPNLLARGCTANVWQGIYSGSDSMQVIDFIRICIECPASDESVDDGHDDIDDV